MQEKEVRQWCMFMHLAQYAGYVVPLGGIIVPVVMWQMKKDEAPAIDAHGRMIVNALISFTIYLGLAALLIFALIGFVLLPLLGLCALVFPIIGALKANDGELWRYPMVISFL